MKKIFLIISALMLSLTFYGQIQWNGELNTTSHIWRTGEIGIGSHFSSGLGYLLQITSNNTDKGVLGFHISGNNGVCTSNAGVSENSSIIFRTSSLGSTSEKMIINYNGNVGIGTTTPDVKLDIKGNIQLSNTGDRKIGFGDFEGKIYYGLGLYGNDVRIIGYNSNNRHIVFGFNDGNENWTPSMTIENNGNIGIGTSETGTHKLAVEGTIGAREIKVEADGWSDFVFNKNYKLKDLEDVESFIEENSHLPDVPSEKEVLENGIQLGKMDAKLLQKIEELTLYMIDINKRVKSLEEENKVLKKENSILKIQ